MVKYFYIIILCLFFLVGCNSTENSTKQKAESNQTNVKSTNKTFNNKDSLENKLLPPKFQITNFDIEYLQKSNELIFFMKYEIDVEIYKILTESNQNLYFSLEYPEHVLKYFTNSTSELILAETPENYNTKYQTEFKTKIDLTEKEINEIKNNVKNYNLLIADNDKDVIAKFVDIYEFNSYDPEISKSTHINETNK